MPAAATLNDAGLPAVTVIAAGWLLMLGATGGVAGLPPPPHPTSKATAATAAKVTLRKKPMLTPR